MNPTISKNKNPRAQRASWQDAHKVMVMFKTKVNGWYCTQGVTSGKVNGLNGAVNLVSDTFEYASDITKIFNNVKS
jgi:hypothetical protein